MKILSVLLFALVLTSPLYADVGLQNGDFSEGITHWHGDGRAPADFASDNPLQASDPTLSKGMIIPLKHGVWAKAEQDFQTGSGNGELTITYLVTPDFALSTNSDDYTNIPPKLGWGWKAFDIPAGSWMVSFNDSTGTKGMHAGVKPSGPPGVPQTFRLPLPAQPHDRTTLTLAFPPGTGKVVILSVSYVEH